MFASLLVFAAAASFASGCVLEILALAAAASFALGCVLEVLVFAAAASFALGCVLEILAFAAAASFALGCVLEILVSLATLDFFTPPINGGAWEEVFVAAESAPALVEDTVTDRALGIVSVVTKGYQAYLIAE